MNYTRKRKPTTKGKFILKTYKTTQKKNIKKHKETIIIATAGKGKRQ